MAGRGGNSSVYYKKLAVTFVCSLSLPLGWLSEGEKRGEGCREERVGHDIFLLILNTMQVGLAYLCLYESKTMRPKKLPIQSS